MKRTFVVKTAWAQSISALPEPQQLVIYRSMFQYNATKEVTVEDDLMPIWTPIQAAFDSKMKMPITGTIEVREKLFGESLVPYVGKYGKDMIRKFYDYWREKNRAQTKMKFEMKDTWDVALRLARWADNNRGETVSSAIVEKVRERI